MTAICLACSLLAAAAGSLFDQGHMDKLNALISGGKIQEAMDLLDRMETEANQLKADHGRFYVRWKRAWCLAQVDDSEKAQEMLESVIKDAAGEFGETYGFLPLMHHNLGEMYLRHRQMELAAEHLDAALDLVDKAVVPGSNPKRPMPIDDTVRLHIQFLRAECFTFRGENEKAREKMEALDQRVTAALKAGRDNGEKADPFLVQLAVEIGVQLAELDRRNSDVPGAVGRLQRCLDELQSDESVAALELRFKCHVLLANVYWETGRFGDAGEELNRADQAVPEKNILDTRDLAIARANLQVEQVASVLESRLEKMATLDRLTEAENAAREALEDCKKADAGPNSFTAIAAYQLAQVRGLRGRAFDARGRNEDARKAFDAALGDCDDALALPESVFPKDHDFVLQVRRYRAWVNLQRGDVDAARKEAEDALKLFVKRHSEDNVDCELFHGVLLEVEEKAENAEAAAGHAEAHRRLAIRRLPYLASLTAPAQVKFFQDYDEPGLHGGLRLGIRFPSVRDRSAEWLLNGKAKIADAAALVYREARGGKEALALQDIVQQQAYLLYGPPDADRDGAKLGQLEAKKRDLAVRQAAKLANNRDAAELARPVRLADLQAKLRPEEIYIDVCCLRPEMNAPRAYYAWIVTAADPVEVRKLGNADEIDGLVKTLQDHMENCGGEHGLAATVGLRSALADLRRTSLDRLSELLLRPLLPLAKGKKRWIVSPDGPLWNVPWAALILPESGRYAVEDYTFRYVTSGRDLLRQTRADAQPGEPWILADPDYNQAPKGVHGKLRPDEYRLPGLKAAREEGDLAAGCLRRFFRDKPLVRTGVDATKAAYLDLTRPPRVVYLATHAGFSLPPSFRGEDGPPVDPLLCCGIAFAGYNFLPDGKGTDGPTLPGLLTGAEVLAVDLHGTDLVVLSACQSGVGVTTTGQSPADLCNAFQLAGAGAVVSTLWRVDDLDAQDEMKLFMQSYADSPETDKAELLAAAQRKLLKDQPHPFVWAAFTLSGS